MEGGKRKEKGNSEPQMNLPAGKAGTDPSTARCGLGRSAH